MRIMVIVIFQLGIQLVSLANFAFQKIRYIVLNNLYARGRLIQLIV